MVIGVIDDIMSSENYNKIIQLFDDGVNSFSKYTEHDGRTGFEITDTALISLFEDQIKKRILVVLNLDVHPSHLKISKIYVCKDDKNFFIPYHYDDKYKYISCILYCGSNFQGTLFLKKMLQKETIETKDNRLVCFRSQEYLHCVPSSCSQRRTIQFYFSLVEDDEQ